MKQYILCLLLHNFALFGIGVSHKFLIIHINDCVCQVINEKLPKRYEYF